jgi:hypothetical protein
MYVTGHLITAVLEKWSVEKYAADIQKAGLILPQTPEIIAITLIKAFGQSLKFEKALLGEVFYFEYVGIKRKDTRDFCLEHMGKTFHLEEIMKMNNGELVPCIIFGGGWGCHHYWEPVPFYKS